MSCVMCHLSCVACHVSCVMCHASHVMCHVLRVTCNLSPVTNTNSHSHRPSPIIHSRLVHSRLVHNRLFPKTRKTWKIIEKKEWKYVNISDTSFDQRTLVHWESSFPGSDMHTNGHETTRLNRPRGRFSENEYCHLRVVKSKPHKSKFWSLNVRIRNYINNIICISYKWRKPCEYSINQESWTTAF